MTHTSNPETDAPTSGGAAADQANDDHGAESHVHAEDSLGPINVAAWGAGALGVVVGLVIAACFVFATMPAA